MINKFKEIYRFEHIITLEMLQIKEIIIIIHNIKYLTIIDNLKNLNSH